jgi:hypothetical protein
MLKRRVFTLALISSLFVLGTAAPSLAQAGSGVVIQAASIYLYPDAALTPLRTAAVDTILLVKRTEGEWLKVDFRDPQYGRREGYVLAKNVRLSAPELEPMDLSVGDRARADQPAAQAQASQPETQIAQPRAPRDVVGARPQIREGFWFNAGMGFGTLGCEDCLDRNNGLSGGISLGRTINDRVLLGLGTTGWAKSVDGEILTVGTLDVRTRIYPVRAAGFFLTGGVGLGSLSYVGESEFGLGVILGVGWDIRVGRNVSLTPFWNGFAMRNSNVDANVGQLGIGVTIH